MNSKMRQSPAAILDFLFEKKIGHGNTWLTRNHCFWKAQSSKCFCHLSDKKTAFPPVWRAFSKRFFLIGALCMDDRCRRFLEFAKRNNEALNLIDKVSDVRWQLTLWFVNNNQEINGEHKYMIYIRNVLLIFPSRDDAA